MLSTENFIALSKWIKHWTETYGEKPTLNECTTWLNWHFKYSSISQKEKNLIKEMLSNNNL